MRNLIFMKKDIIVTHFGAHGNKHNTWLAQRPTNGVIRLVTRHLRFKSDGFGKGKRKLNTIDWRSEHWNMSKPYQTMLRINGMFTSIKKGESGTITFKR